MCPVAANGLLPASHCSLSALLRRRAFFHPRKDLARRRTGHLIGDSWWAIRLLRLSPTMGNSFNRPGNEE